MPLLPYNVPTATSHIWVPSGSGIVYCKECGVVNKQATRHKPCPKRLESNNQPPETPKVDQTSRVVE